MSETSSYVTVAYGMPKRTPRKFPFVKKEEKPVITIVEEKHEEPTIAPSIEPVVKEEKIAIVEEKQGKKKEERKPKKVVKKETKKKEAKTATKKES